MAKPNTSITTFSFYCTSFEELPAKLEEYVGYKVTPSDIFSMTIEESATGGKLRVVLSIIYWDATKARAT